MTWRKEIEQFEREAAAVLAGYRLPTSSAQLLKGQHQPRDQYSKVAMIIIHAVERLRREVERGDIEHALDCFLSICGAVVDLRVMRNAGEYRDTGFLTTEWPNTKGGGLSPYLYRDLNRGIAYTRRTKKGTTKGAPEAKRKQGMASFAKVTAAIKKLQKEGYKIVSGKAIAIETGLSESQVSRIKKK